MLHDGDIVRCTDDRDTTAPEVMASREISLSGGTTPAIMMAREMPFSFKKTCYKRKSISYFYPYPNRQRIPRRRNRVILKENSKGTLNISDNDREVVQCHLEQIRYVL